VKNAETPNENLPKRQVKNRQIARWSYGDFAHFVVRL